MHDRTHLTRALLVALPPALLATGLTVAVCVLAAGAVPPALAVLAAGAAGLTTALGVGVPLARRAAGRSGELSRAREAAEAQSRARAELLAWVSHEVRTPLDGVLGYARLLARTPLDAHQLAHLRTILRSGETLLTLASDLLDFARAEANRLRFETVPFELRDTAEAALDLVAPGARERGLELALVCRPGVPRVVLGDPQRLTQVLLNLVANAVRFTRHGGVAVEVSSVLDDGAPTLLWTVSDTGRGMARQERGRLFEPFSGTEGTGLGLVIARTWVERMGGRLEVASREGLGTTVTFTLPCVTPSRSAADTAGDCPLAGRTALVFDPFGPTCRSLTATLESWGAQVTPVESAAALRQTLAGHARFDLVVMGLPPGGDSRPELAVAAQVARQRTGRPALLLVNAEGPLPAERCARLGGVGGLLKPVRSGLLREALLDLLSSPEGAPVPGAAEEPAPPPRLLPHGPRVLVVEDEAVSRNLLVRLLEGWGARVETAHDGQQALARAATGEIDLVVMDLHMPGLDGVETTRRLRRQQTGTRHLPVLALSADAHGDTRRRVIEAGLDDFLTKPVQEDALFGALAYWLGRGGHAGAPVATGQADEAVIDRSAAVRIAGDADGADRLLRLMLAELPFQRTELADALAAGNLPRVAEVAHKIAGGAIYCAARALEGVARRLEQVARAGDPAGVGREALALDAEIERLIRAGPGASGTHLADGDERPRGG